MFKFHSEDVGNYRVYYKRNREFINGELTKRLTDWFCIQNNGGWGKDDYQWYVCSSDGEPSHTLSFPHESSFDKLIYPHSLARSVRSQP
jgi:hypothetical protein